MSGAIRAEGIRWAPALPAKSLERWYFVAALSLVGMLPYFLGAQPVNERAADAAEIFAQEGDPTKQVVLGLVYASFGLLLITRVRLAMLLRLGAPLILLMVLCAASALWSDLPLIALRRSGALAGTVTIAVYAGLRFDVDELLELLCRVVAIVIVASFVVAALEPSLGLDSEGRFRGVFAHKNTFGIFAALGILALTARLSRRPSREEIVLCVLSGLACLTGLVLADSAASVPALAAGLVFLAWAYRVRAANGALLASLLAAVCVIAITLPWTYNVFGVLAVAVGRDADFSHRDLVWRFALDLLSRNPWLGYGYEAFWNGSAGELFLRWSGFAVSHSHNGFLQLALDTGLLGVAALLCALAMLVRRTLAFLGSTDRAPVAWLIGFTAFYIVASAAETHAWKTNDLVTLLFVYAVVHANVRWRHARA